MRKTFGPQPQDRDDIEDLTKIPLDKQLPFKTTYEAIQTTAKNFATKPAIIFLPTGGAEDIPIIINYEMLLVRINQAANLFLSFKEKTISYLLPNLPQTHFVLWGAQAVGTVNPIRPDLSAEQIIAILKKANSNLLVTVGEFIAPPIWQTVLAVKKSRPQLKILVIGGKQNPDNNIYNFDELLEKQSAEFSPRNISETDICSYFHTSATTSIHPKLCRHTHRAQIYAAWAMGTCFGYQSHDVLTVGLPFFHVGAPMLSLAAFMCGATTIMLSPLGWMEPNVIKNFWKIVDKYRITLTAALDFTYAQLLPVSANSNSLRLAISGTPISFNIAFEYWKTGTAMVDIYGSTETIMACCNPSEYARTGSMGLPLPYVKTKVMALDDQRECTENEVGELWIAGPNLTDGYQQETTIDRSAFVQSDQHWFRTGDLARRDAKNYFWFFDRLCDVIRHQHGLISSILLEQLFESHPAVDRAAVIAQLDETSQSEVPVLFVTVKKGSKLTIEELKNFARQQIAKSSEMPVEFFIEENFPLNGIAKIIKPILREKLHREKTEPALAL